MSTVSGAWSEEKWSSGCIVWLLSSKELGLKNIRLITEFILFTLFECLVGTSLVDCENIRSNESAISTSRSLWNEYEGS